MSIRDELDLRDKLGTALDDLAPGPLPLQAVVRQGRSVMIRRRVTLAVTAAVVVAAAAATPAILHRLSHASPPSGTHYHVTDVPPGPGSPKGLIATVGVDGHRWKVFGLLQSGLTCFRLSAQSECSNEPPQKVGHVGDPAFVVAQLSTRPYLEIGWVRGDVTDLRLSLSNGQLITLRPVAVFGRARAAYFAFAVPATSDVTQLFAYSTRGEIGYAVPFTGLRQVSISRWLRPDQAALPRPARYLIGHGTIGGKRWAEYAWVGPWGICTGAGVGLSCMAAGPAAVSGRHHAATDIVSIEGRGPYYAVVFGVPEVDHVIVRPAKGRAFRVRMVAADGGKLCAFALARTSNTARWTAYSATGAALASGRTP